MLFGKKLKMVTFLGGISLLCVAQTPVGKGKGQQSKIQIALLGDLPYNEPRVTWDRLLEDIAQHKPAFAVHVGDIKSGGSRCDDDAYLKIKGDFNKLPTAVFYTPGDNEWTDCHRKSNGGFEPIERLAFLRKVLTSGNRSLGQKTLPLTRQSTLKGYETYRENAHWSIAGVQFVTIHVVGSNNNKGRSKGGSLEYQRRDKANLFWLKHVFKLAQAKRGIMLMIHADLDFEERWDKTDGFDNFKEQLAKEVLGYEKPVVLVHGDSHFFRFDKPLRHEGKVVANFSRVEVFGAKDVHWVQATVHPTGPDLFTFHPKIVRANLRRSAGE